MGKAMTTLPLTHQNISVCVCVCVCVCVWWRRESGENGGGVLIRYKVCVVKFLSPCRDLGDSQSM